MNLKSPQQYDARARIAKAIAHPTRLLLLDALGHNELCVNELTELAGVDQSTVSKHLTLLREIGLVAARKEGTTHRYRITCRCLGGMFDCIESVLRENLEAQKKLLSG
ncbi:MAG: winged helix-turn-helix transcriptional regulator [Candidatus Eisenbacteria bacterium]|nr:winged helix-turn-helix transcriptional regulator [Candidatus Eisenbacteria bacterium]